MKLASLPRACALLTVAYLQTVDAFRVPIVGRRLPHDERETRRLGRRTIDMNGSFGNGSILVNNAGDTLYSCNVTLGGAEFEVLIDTGSSDLWVTGTVPKTKNLTIPAKVSYAEGEASGFISTADLIFDQYTIKDQAFIDVVPSKNNPPSQGLIGLGPSKSSNIRGLVKSKNLQNVSGAPPLDRIFQQNKTTPNFISVLLSRISDDLPGSTPQTGELTIGTVIPGYESIRQQKQLPALVDSSGVQHWQALLDANGIIGPDGRAIQTTTTVSDSPKNQLHAVFDTGFTFPQVQQDVADAIYGRVPGAQWVGDDTAPGYWRIPCDYELNTTFLFDGVKYPIAPLDLSMVETVDGSGKPVHCMSTFQQISPAVADHSKFGAFDMILGMAFLRNAYLLIDFGDFVDGSAANVSDPYIQLLSTTDPASAHADFVKSRLGGKDLTGSQEPLLPPGQGQHSPNITYPDNSSSDNPVTHVVNNVKNKVKSLFTNSIWFIVAVSVGGFLLLAAIAFFIFRCCNRRRSKVRSEGAFLPTMTGAAAYKPLRESMAGPGARPSSPVWDHTYGERNNNGYGYPASGQYTEPQYQHGGRY